MDPFQTHFNALSRPHRVALIGGDDRPDSVELILARSLMVGEASRVLEIVDPAERRIGGRRALSRIDALSMAPDLAAIAPPADDLAPADTNRLLAGPDGIIAADARLTSPGTGRGHDSRFAS